MKHCSKCDTDKEDKEFNRNSARTDCLAVYCIDCEYNVREETRQKSIDKQLQDNFIEGEIWKTLPFNEKYEVSSLGRVRNSKFKKLSTPFTYHSGYLGISLRSDDGTAKTYKIHQLIAITFLPNDKNKLTVNHKNKNRSDNSLINLEWATHEEQIKHQNESRTPSKHKSKRITDLTNINADERWETIKNFETYQISNYGRLKYKKQDRTYITLGSVSSDGYRISSLNNGENKISIAIHRLVAEYFVENPLNKPYVNHEDGDRQNNYYKNLSWVTPSENSQHAHDTRLNTSKKEIYQLNTNNEIIQKFSSLKEASEVTKIQKSVISRVLNDKSKTAGGFCWSFCDTYKLELKELTKYDNNKTKIVQKDKETKEVIKIWDSINDAADYISKIKNSSKHATATNISNCARKLRNSCQGFIWEYCE